MLERMAQTMTHRGPDGEGTWSDGGIGFAFRRLAIIDLHERSNQPMHLGPLHLVFNGEIYNYPELRDELRTAGHRFQTEGDSEVLLHAWAQWGERALDRLNGAFAFAVWDARTQRMTLAVDRFAEKPLFVHRGKDRLLFASNVGALRVADRAVGVPDGDAIQRFLALGTMPPLPATFFRDLERLGPSHVATWQAGAWSLRRYWDPPIVDVPRATDDAAARLRELLRASVRVRLRSDVPVGTSLSGGVDSSVVVSLAADLAPEASRHAFTATFTEFERDEWRYAAAVAKSARIAEHHAVRPTVDSLLDDLRAFVAAQEEPFGSTSIYAQWCVMRAARESGVVVLLDGQGADELFGGYAGVAGWALRSQGPRHTLASILRHRPAAREIAVAYSAGRAPHWVARRDRLRHASPYVGREVAFAAADWSQPNPDWNASGSPLRRELLNQTFRTSLPNLCRFADRDSMDHSVETRLPFLDPAVAAFALSLPPDLVYARGVTKRLLRLAARGLVPDEVLDRGDKIGYETPERQWYEEKPARTLIGELLLNGDDVQLARGEIERDLCAGSWRDPGAIWRATNVQLWLADLRSQPKLT